MLPMDISSARSPSESSQNDLRDCVMHLANAAEVFPLAQFAGDVAAHVIDGQQVPKFGH